MYLSQQLAASLCRHIPSCSLDLPSVFSTQFTVPIFIFLGAADVTLGALTKVYPECPGQKGPAKRKRPLWFLLSLGLVSILRDEKSCFSRPKCLYHLYSQRLVLLSVFSLLNTQKLLGSSLLILTFRKFLPQGMASLAFILTDQLCAIPEVSF